MMVKQNSETDIPKSKPFSYRLFFRFWKWDFSFTIMSKEYKDHFCLNQIMEGNYDCEVCNPLV